jgi:hypothetical protein
MTQTKQPEITSTQQRYLDEIRANPGQHYKGHARRPLERLRELGLIEYSYEHLASIGSDLYICHPTNH